MVQRAKQVGFYGTCGEHAELYLDGKKAATVTDGLQIVELQQSLLAIANAYPGLEFVRDLSTPLNLSS